MVQDLRGYYLLYLRYCHIMGILLKIRVLLTYERFQIQSAVTSYGFIAHLYFSISMSVVSGYFQDPMGGSWGRDPCHFPISRDNGDFLVQGHSFGDDHHLHSQVTVLYHT